MVYAWTLGRSYGVYRMISLFHIGHLFRPIHCPQHLMGTVPSQRLSYKPSSMVSCLLATQVYQIFWWRLTNPWPFTALLEVVIYGQFRLFLDRSDIIFLLIVTLSPHGTTFTMRGTRLLIYLHLQDEIYAYQEYGPFDLPRRLQALVQIDRYGLPSIRECQFVLLLFTLYGYFYSSSLVTSHCFQKVRFMPLPFVPVDFVFIYVVRESKPPLAFHGGALKPTKAVLMLLNY